MKSLVKSIFVAGSLVAFPSVYAEDGHDHSKHEKKKDAHANHDDHSGHDDHKGGDDHKGHDDHSGHDDHKGHDDHGGEKFGVGKGIVEVKEGGKHFKLSKDAMKTLKLDTVRLDPATKGTYEVPTKSVVTHQGKTGVYRKKGAWFEMISVQVVKRGKYGAQIKSKKLSRDDLVVSEGVGLLRVAHLEASGQGGKGHVH